MNFLYWDKITLGGTKLAAQGKKVARINIFVTINQTDSAMLASSIDPITPENILSYSFSDFFKSRPLAEKIPITPNFWLLWSEVAMKVVAAAIVDAYVYTREKLKESNTWYGALFWGALTAVTGLANAMIAQPLAFVANTLSHVRTVWDGFCHVVGSLFKKDVKAKSGLKAMARGGLCLLIDGLVAGVAYGLAAICSVIPGAQVAVPFLTGTTTVVQAAMGSVAVSATSAAVAATSAATLVAGSNVVQSRMRSANKSIFNMLGIAKKQHYAGVPGASPSPSGSSGSDTYSRVPDSKIEADYIRADTPRATPVANPVSGQDDSDDDETQYRRSKVP